MSALQTLEHLANSMLCCFCFVLPLAPGYLNPTEQVLADVHRAFMNDFILIPSSHFLCVQLSEGAVFLTTGISCNFHGLLNDTIFQGPVSHEAPACVLPGGRSCSLRHVTLETEANPK